MGWDDNGRYYTRTRKVNGRYVREYIGGGEVGELAAESDRLRRQEREALNAAVKAKREELNDLDADMGAVSQELNMLAKVALLAAGFYQHKRQWRKTGGNNTTD